MILLFERRFGGQVWRPIGRDWWEQGYWKVYDHPATVSQFLDIGGATPDGTEPLNNVIGNGAQIGNDGKRMPVYHCFDIDSRESNKGITLEGFLNTSIDFVIATIPAHVKPFYDLCQRHPSRPKLIYQIGNAWNIADEFTSLVDGIMASARIDRVSNKPMVEYHQEFDLDIFYPSFKSIPENNIFSFINCFNIDQLFADDWQLFETMENLMAPNWNFKAYGGQCRDGAAHGARELSTAMRSAKFIWHTKRGGDGYGHVVHNSAAVGRPTIVNRSYYSGKLAESLLIDGETCIVIDGLGPNEIKNKIDHYSQRREYSTLAHNVADNFRKVVDFDAESKTIRAFLESLL